MITTTNTTTAPPATTRGRAGQQVELARYILPGGGERVVMGQRVNGTVILLDAPIGEEGRVYLIERGVEQDGNAALQAIVTNYLQTAATTAAIPMSRGNHRPG